MAEIRSADGWFEKFWCGCGDGDPEAVLVDYLAAFRDLKDPEEESCYPRWCIDLDLAETFRGKHGNDVLHLLGYLLDGAGLIEHSGSVVSGAWLTPLGEEVRERALAGEFGEGTIRLA